MKFLFSLIICAALIILLLSRSMKYLRIIISVDGVLPESLEGIILVLDSLLCCFSLYQLIILVALLPLQMYWKLLRNMSILPCASPFFAPHDSVRIGFESLGMIVFRCKSFFLPESWLCACLTFMADAVCMCLVFI